MTAASPVRLAPVSTYVRKRLADLLDQQRVVVWYDPESAFSALLLKLDLPNCVIIDASSSSLRARRKADAAYVRLDESGGDGERRGNLLIYVPRARGATSDEQQQDPFEAYARCGAAFGDNDAESSMSLATMALPERRDEVARLFRDGHPPLDVLDHLAAGERFPMVRQALGTESAVEALARALSLSDTGERLAAAPGASAELVRLAQTELGLHTREGEKWPALRTQLAQYVLVSELGADLPNGLPSGLATVPHADPAHQERALDVCERMRDSDTARDVYVELAEAVEKSLRLRSQLGTDTPLGTRDTFPCQERLRLSAVVHAAVAGDLGRAQILVSAGEKSVWRRNPERALLWQVVQRCLNFLDQATGTAGVPPPKTVRAAFDAYIAADGLWQLDHAQRLFENAGAHCAEDDEVEALLQTCRAQYRVAVVPTQKVFQAAVQSEGWPPDGVRRQTQTFDTHVAPALTERRKVAYFLVDSLRYEMGRDLVDAVGDIGSVTVDGVATVLPTSTPCGMAALMPGADGAFTFMEHHGDLVPAVGGTPLPERLDRTAFLQTKYGDRVRDLTLGDLLSTAPKRLKHLVGDADLVVVRTQDIDALGEGSSLFRARKAMSDVIGELRDAATRLVSLGYETLVFSSDHGHVLVPETLPGDVVTAPAGQWRLKKRRSLVGHKEGSSPGVMILLARDVGIQGPVEDFAAATEFKTFQDGAGYFHEGLSLQECIVPVVVVRARRQQMPGGGEQVTISYRSDRFTSTVVGLKLTLASMFETRLGIRLEAFDGTGPRANSVGMAGDCDARDTATGDVVLEAGVETQVPLGVDSDFNGPSVDVRASDPRTGAILARLSLKNGRMD